MDMATNKDSFSLVIHMVSSLDGLIAKKDNSVSWFETTSPYEQGVVGENPDEFLKTIDCYVMGSHTYELAVELSKSYGWAYGDKPTIVVTSRKMSSERSNIEFYAGDLTQLVKERLQPRYGNVWMVGGAMLAKEFIRLNLATEMRITVLPVILGSGVPMFDQTLREQPLHLKNVTPYKNGMVELRYGFKDGYR